MTKFTGTLKLTQTAEVKNFTFAQLDEALESKQSIRIKLTLKLLKKRMLVRNFKDEDGLTLEVTQNVEDYADMNFAVWNDSKPFGVSVDTPKGFEFFKYYLLTLNY